MVFNPSTVDYDAIHGLPVSSILGTGAQILTDGSTSFEEIAFIAGDKALVVSVNQDTDEIILRVEHAPSFLTDNAAGWENCELLREYIGRELGWAWTAINCKGYADTLILSFAGIEPEVLLCGVASTIEFYKLHKL